MSHKRLRFQAEAREKVLRGAQALADAVRVTLGPKSKSVLVERKWGGLLLCRLRRTMLRELPRSARTPSRLMRSEALTAQPQARCSVLVLPQG